jgi:nucleoside phosphorylase
MIRKILSSLFGNDTIEQNVYTKSFISSKKSYNFLVVAARQDELSAFIDQTDNLKKGEKVEFGVRELRYVEKKLQIEILTYTSANMGMAFNAASIMRIICKYQPMYTIFIGTCAGLNSDKNKCGDVLIPQNIYNYESGKHKDNNEFESDHNCFSTDDDMRKYAEILKNKLDKKINIIADEHFCTGSAIIDSKQKKDEIISRLPRKVTGLDMESYSIACINYILREEGKKLCVVKSIMDFGEKKTESEGNDNKKLAMYNSGKVTLELIKYIHNEIINNRKDYII